MIKAVRWEGRNLCSNSLLPGIFTWVVVSLVWCLAVQ